MADASPTFPDIADLGYEAARDELVTIVSQLEAGQAPLEDSMQLWRRGEALAAHCARWLDGAQAEIEGTPEQDADAPSGMHTAPPTADRPVHADDKVFDEPH
ncbi:MAG: exodeoxyribonuclease VII small subunit [Dermatophilaceae bacterium]